MTLQQPVPWAHVNPLDEALHFLRMSGAFYCKSDLTAPWGLELPQLDGCLSFHVVIDGACRLEFVDPEVDHAPHRPHDLSDQSESSCVELRSGDLALVRDGFPHVLCSSEGVATPNVVDLHHDYESERYAVLRHGGGGVGTSLVCGVARFDHPAARQLLASLPPVITICDTAAPQSEWIRGSLGLMASEARTMRPGSEAVLTRLADILVIQAIRTWIEDDRTEHTGWLAGLRDDQIGRALTSIHRDPAHGWTVEELAHLTSMSRSAFSAKFSEIVGEPAIRYATRWRMHVALDRLHGDDVSISCVAGELGYESEASFSRAFKRVLGTTPGAIRRAAKATAQVGTSA